MALEKDAEVAAGEEPPGSGGLAPGTGSAAAKGIQEITERNLVTPRDASLVAGRLGLKVLPEANSDAAVLYGVSARQGRSITRRVSETLQHIDKASPGGDWIAAGTLCSRRGSACSISPSRTF